MRPGGGEPNAPGWTVRVVPNLYPALSPRLRATPRHANPDLFWSGAGARRARGDHQLAQAGHLAVRARGRRGGGRGRRLARADARPPGRRLRASDRQRAARGGGVAAPQPRAAVRARLRAGGDRARARALRRLRDADDGRQPARRPRPGRGAPARADRGDRRRSRADGSVRRSRPVPAADRAAHAADALRGRRADRRGDAARGAVAAGASPGRQPAVEPVGPDRTAGSRALLLADRHPPAADAPGGPRARRRREPQHRRRPSASPRSFATHRCGPWSSACRAPRCRSTGSCLRDRPGAAGAARRHPRRHRAAGRLARRQGQGASDLRRRARAA